jgi:phage-related minor tail protein
MVDVSYSSSADEFGRAAESGDRLAGVVDQLAPRMRDLQSGANAFARAMTGAFTSSVSGGRQFDDVLKSLMLRLSDASVRMALAPIARGLASGIGGAFAGLFGGTGGAAGRVTDVGSATRTFAAGGVIGAPTYFPLAAGGHGLAGEAGPEAIMPLARGADGRLGIAMTDRGASQVTVNISTPDAASFRGAEVYLTGQIARAVARGQRGL